MSLAPASDQPPPYEVRQVQVGEWTVTALSDGFFRLDGGGMWGVVPATMWRQWTPAAEDNTILLALRPFLARRGDDVVLIEVGVGDRWQEKWQRIYHMLPTTTLEQSLAAAGVKPEDVTHVVASHCHWDHIGSQVATRDGVLVPRFPNARHFAPEIEVAMCLDPDHVRQASYRPEDVAPIRDAGLLSTYSGDAELLPGLRVHELGGHSDGVTVITLNEEEQGDTAIFWADVVPTAHHIQPSFIMAFDIDVARSYGVRSAWLERASREGWLGLFYHDVDHPFGRIGHDGKRYVFEPVAGERRA